MDFEDDFRSMESCYPYCPYYRQFFPPSPPGRPPSGPGGGPGAGRPPSGPPPSFTPSQPQFQALAVDPGAIRPCLFRFVFIWPRRGRGFWAWLTFVGPRSVAGFRWTGSRWVFFGMDLRQIDQFTCF
ncbi:hypothetical protein KQI86_04675 [Clostridium sp. MSJ-11]|uniref:Uncharacterized protein n=2 Tax=Clostridium mobile TaxID=2841512 RepID=A0ABS6EF03_9CLOT|nr:hypothetical protein [Clostridium mobile]